MKHTAQSSPVTYPPLPEFGPEVEGSVAALRLGSCWELEVGVASGGVVITEEIGLGVRPVGLGQ
eukprot:1148188-Pelagomonas_calceolata.AAC.8